MYIKNNNAVNDGSGLKSDRRRRKVLSFFEFNSIINKDYELYQEL